jgi:hypothetical protein
MQQRPTEAAAQEQSPLRVGEFDFVLEVTKRNVQLRQVTGRGRASGPKPVYCDLSFSERYQRRKEDTHYDLHSTH